MYCQNCGALVEENATRCKRCGSPPIRVRAASGGLDADPAMRFVLPVGTSLWAIAAGYAGLFAILIFPAPIALLLGIMALRDLKRHPEKYGIGRAILGMVTGTLGTLVLLVFLGALMIQSFH